MLSMLHNFIGKNVSIDGCHVGVLTALEVEQEQFGLMTMKLNLYIPNECVDKMREYEYIQSVMGGESIIEKEKPNKRRKSR